jgi:peptide/nickel transport system substrate-binding protein
MTGKYLASSGVANVAADLRTTIMTRRKLLGASIAAGGVMAFGGQVGSALAQDETPVRGGVARIAGFGALTSLDPFTWLNSDNDRMCSAALYDTLIALQPDGSFAPELATEWSISDDNLIYTFTLREGITFHDGTVLDAEAVKFNFDRYRVEDSTYPAVTPLRPIATVEALDSATVVFTLANPSAPFLIGVSYAPIVSPTAVETLGEDFQLQGVGSGPFKYGEWTPGSVAKFTRNEAYWQNGADGQPLPYYDSVEFDAVADDSVRLLNLRSGEFDYVERLSIRDVQTASVDQSIQVHTTLSNTGYCLAMNPNQAPFDNKTLRQAVQAAVNLQAIIDNISFGEGYLSSMGFARDTWFFMDDPAPVYDPELARQLLTEAGYPDGIDVSFSIINRPVDNQIAQIVADNLNEVGIRTTIDVLERTTWVDLWTSRQGQIGSLIAGGGATDPGLAAGQYDPGSQSNFAGYDNPAIMDLIDQQNQTTDQEERNQIWREIAGIRIDDAVYVQVGIVPGYGAASAAARDFNIHAHFLLQFDAAWNAE